MLTYDKDTQRISFRHYSIRAAPSGVSKSVKALLARDQLPDMHDYADVSEFLTKSGYGSVRLSGFRSRASPALLEIFGF